MNSAIPSEKSLTVPSSVLALSAQLSRAEEPRKGANDPKTLDTNISESAKTKMTKWLWRSKHQSNKRPPHDGTDHNRSSKKKLKKNHQIVEPPIPLGRGKQHHLVLHSSGELKLFQR